MAKKDGTKDSGPKGQDEVKNQPQTKSEKEAEMTGHEKWEALSLAERQKMEPEDIAELRGIPFHRYINAGTAPIIVPERDLGASMRLEPGDYVDGEYYEKVFKKVRHVGFARMCTVDTKRLAELAKIRRLRTGEELPDWIKEARKAAADQKASPGRDPMESLIGGDPAELLSRAAASARPHAADEK